jgi:hypothetical protein
MPLEDPALQMPEELAIMLLLLGLLCMRMPSLIRETPVELDRVLLELDWMAMP